MNFNSPVLQQIYDAEEADNIVLSIREELMERVMTECYNSYIKKQSIRFIVQCAYDALVKFLSINFYYHYAVPDIRDSIWTPDKPIDPSPKDTWARSAVPIRSRYFKDDLDDDGDDLTVNTTKRDSCHTVQCTCTGMVCNCMILPDEIFKTIETYVQPCPSRVRFSPKSSTLEKSESKEKITPKSLLSSVHSSSPPSSFTHRTTTDSLKSLSEDEKEYDKSALLSRKKTPVKKKSTLFQKNMRTEVPVPTKRGSQASLQALPPIRVDTNFNAKPEESKKKK